MPVKPKITLSLAQHRKIDVVKSTTTEIYTHVSKRSLANIKSPLDQNTAHKQLNN